MHRPIKDLGQGILHLPDRKPGSIAGLAVGLFQGKGQAMEPTVQKGLDRLGSQWITEGLEPGRVGTPLEAVVQGFKSNPFLFELTFGPFMAVEVKAIETFDAQRDLFIEDRFDGGPRLWLSFHGFVA